MSIIRDFTLYLHAGISVPPVVHVNQYDQGEVWRFTLLDEDGTQYTPSTGALIGVKSDGHAIAGVTGTVLGDGRVSITETQQMTAAAGKAVFELTIDGGSHGTANFIVQVEPKPTDSAILSDSDLSIIQEGMNSVTPVVIAETVSDWLEDNLTNPPIDPSLTISNAAADAKVTGDKITELKTEIEYEKDYSATVYNDNDEHIKSLLTDDSAIEFKHYEYLTLGGLAAGVPVPSNDRCYTDFISLTAPNDPTYYYDSTTYRINIVRYDANKNFVGQTGNVAIQPIRIKAYITSDPYVRIVVSRADSGNIVPADVLLYTKETTANNIAYMNESTSVIKTNVLTVKPDGSGDFTTIKAAIDSISDNSYNNRYVIEVYEGTYNLKTEYSAQWGQSGFIGCTVPPYVKLKGVGNRESIILTAEDTTTAESIRINMATVNLYQTSELENLTIKGEGLKYTVHDDFKYTGEHLDGYREINNVHVMGDNPLTSAIWGAGAWANTKTRFKNCIWSSNNKIAPFYMHTSTSAGVPTYIEFVNCRFKSYNTSFGDCRIYLTTANNANMTPCFCTLIGSKVKTVYLGTETNVNNIAWHVNGFGNESQRNVITLDGYDSNIDLICTTEYSRYTDGAY